MYKPEQLPFKEFEEVVKTLKKQMDNMGPHYPLFAKAVDHVGLELMQQHFMSPFQRPAAQVTNDSEDWSPPITIAMTDSSGTTIEEQLSDVTAKASRPKNIQLDYFNDEE